MSLSNSVEFKQAEAKAQSSKDYSNLLRILVPLAENGNAEAQCYLATMYHLGTGVNANGKTAVYWYKLAAEQGCSLASNNLSTLYATGGPNLAVNHELSAYWRQQSVAQGFPA